MTDRKKQEGGPLDRLTDALVDDILGASDAEILAEAAELGSDPAQIANDIRTRFETAVLHAGKARMLAARKAVTMDRQRGGAVIPLKGAEARRRYDELVASDATLASKLTLAARKGEGQSERDIESTIEDLAELGALDEDEDNRG